MKGKNIYKIVKRISDQSVRLANKWLPALKPTEVTVVVPPTGPFKSVLPRNFEQLPVEFAKFFVEEISLPAVHLFTLRQVKVSWHAVVFDYLRTFKPALAKFDEEVHYLDSYLIKKYLAPQVAQPAGYTIALVHNQWTRDNYYHWIIDSLCRLLVLRVHFAEALLITPEPAPAYVRTSAAILGFRNFLPLTESQIVHATELVIPEHAMPNGFHHPILLPQLRAELVAGLSTAAHLPTPTRRIYVSRSKQKSRRLRNEEATYALLARYNFEVIYFEGLSLEQQAQLMLETKVLIGVHGANLTNLLFLQAGATVVELMNKEKFFSLGNKNFENLNYYRMSSCLGLSYFALPCQNVPDQLPSNASDVLVELEAFEEILRQV